MAYVKVHVHFARVFRLKAESVYDVTLASFVNVPCSDDLRKVVNSNCSSKEERMDFALQRSSGSPGLNFQLVITRLLWKSNKTIAFNPMSAPIVNRVNLKQKIRSLVDFITLCQKLEVEREREMAHVLCALHSFVVVNHLNSCFA